MRYLSLVCILCGVLVTIVNIRKEYVWQQNLKRDHVLTQVLLIPNPMRSDKDNADFNRGVMLGKQIIYEAENRVRKEERYWYCGIAFALCAIGGLMLWFSSKRDNTQA